MTYIDHYAGNADFAQNRTYLADVYSCPAAIRKYFGEAHSTCSSFLTYLAHSNGPTPSASAIVYGSIAVAGAVLYEAWNDEPAAETSRRGLIRARGCLRRFANELHLKAVDELRLHQDVFVQHFRYPSVDSRKRKTIASLQIFQKRSILR